MATVKYAFLCEDLREEVGGQMIALGLWGSRCKVLGEPPAALRSLAFHAHIENREQVPIPWEFELLIPALEPQIQATGKLSIKPGIIANNLNITLAPVMIPAPGTVVAKLRLLTMPVVEHVVKLEIVFDPPEKQLDLLDAG